MEEITKIESIDQYDQLFGLETLHPLVNVIDFSKATKTVDYYRMNIGFYSLFLKDAKCGDLRYGRKYYDYQEGTVVCMAPGQVIGIDNRKQTPIRTKSIGLLFHPDLIRGTSLGQNIKHYSFFSYEVNEALHLSEQEREIVTDCIHKIQIELEHAIDKHSKQLIVRNIELLLDYCMRFYERQFITRNQANKDIIVKFEQLLDEYFQNQTALTEGLPSVKYFADKVCLSSNYFGDLIKKETGKTAQEYIQHRIIELAKERILEGSQTVSQIAYELGFQYRSISVGCSRRMSDVRQTNISNRTKNSSTNQDISYVMGDKVLKIGSVHQCNCCMGSKTLHPLVSVIDLSKADLSSHTDFKFGFYTILLSECKCEAYRYGHQYYDFSDGTLLCLTPGESISMKDSDNTRPSKGWILAFHPDLICGTVLGANIRDYTFFSYRPEEALHVSLREKQVILELLDKINEELQRCIDCYSQKIISKYIELLLDYCERFYERQFITRNEANKKIIERFDRLLDDHFNTIQSQSADLPTIEECVRVLRLSPAYFNDLLEYETGKSYKEYLQSKRFETAKEWLINTDKPLSQIAQELGFRNPQYFSRLFKKITGCLPNDFKMPN